MRVAIDYTPALRQGAGIGRYTRSLVAALAQEDRQNDYTLFCAGTAPDRAAWPANFRIRTTPVSPHWLGIAWHRLHLPVPAELLAGSCDLFHCPDFTLPPLAHARGVVTVHDLSFMRVPECAEPKLRSFLLDAVPAAVRRARLVLADSENTRADLMDLLQVPAGKIAVVLPAIEPGFRPVTDRSQLARVRERYGLPDPFILAVGTLEPRKNFARLIQAFGRLRREQRIPHHLVVAGGRGWLYQGIFEQVESERLADQVHFPGFVADEDLPALYSLADVFVFPSLYEGFGIPPVEAMACGTPVVCSDNSSLPEAVGDAALRVKADDVNDLAAAISTALSDPALRTRLVARGYQQAARFTWRDAARRLVAAYSAAAA